MIEVAVEKTFRSKGIPSVELSFQCKIPLEEISVIFGESGVGKTSLFKMMAGLLLPDRGNITVAGEVWFDSEENVNLPISKRSLSVLFPDHLLFPHMNVRENLEFSIPKGKNDKSLFQDLVEVTEITSILAKSISQLSSGQKQRVSLVRSLLQKPSLLLLDEPFSSLDGKLRQKLMTHLTHLQKEWGMTILLITHEIPEVVRLAKHVFVLENGRVKEFGNPIQIFKTNEIGNLVGEVVQEDPRTKEVSIWIPNQLVNLESSREIRNQNQNQKEKQNDHQKQKDHPIHDGTQTSRLGKRIQGRFTPDES